jgi:hypothetical protein
MGPWQIWVSEGALAEAIRTRFVQLSRDSFVIESLTYQIMDDMDPKLPETELVSVDEVAQEGRLNAQNSNEAKEKEEREAKEEKEAKEKDQSIENDGQVHRPSPLPELVAENVVPSSAIMASTASEATQEPSSLPPADGNHVDSLMADASSTEATGSTKPSSTETAVYAIEGTSVQDPKKEAQDLPTTSKHLALRFD